VSDTIPAAQLQAADVLLFRGTGWLAKAIRFFDGTDFNHAGLYMGDPSVAEALKPGVVRQSLAESLKGRQRVIARRLINPPPTMTPVTAVAETVLAAGHRYAFEQLLLLALLCLTRKLPMTPWLRPLVRKALDAAAGLLARILGQGKEPMICSEFVYRCYDEALPDPVDVYSLQVGEMTLVPPPEAGATAFAFGLSVAPPRARGRGVHPHSLLAVEMARRIGAPPQLEATPSPSLVPEPVAAAELDSLITKYFEEVQATPSLATPEAAAVSADLDAAVARFARTYYMATAGPAKEAVALSSAGPMEHLFRTAADFVTPGDLLNTQSLVTIGEVK